jgi:hypothetical protein
MSEGPRGEGAVVPGVGKGCGVEGGKETPLPCPHVGPHHRLVARSEARCALIYVDVGAYLGSLESARGVGWKEGRRRRRPVRM